MNVRSVARGAFAVTLLLLTVRPAAAQQAFGFDKPPAYNIEVPQFTDRQVTQLVAKLDSLLAAPADAGKWRTMAQTTLAEFGRRLQMGRLTTAQQDGVLEHLTGIERAHPAEASVLDAPRFTVSKLTIGKVVPEITGTDLDGAELHLSDYRGKVVVLAFWGQWCGICRTEYPYERLLLELYKNWPFAIVGVNSDRTREIGRQAAAGNNLAYRSWWDGPSDTPGNGLIASAWNVTGWPMVYVLDARGVIRYVDLGHEDLLKAVRELLDEHTRTAGARAAK